MSAPPAAKRATLSGELGATTLAGVLQTLEMRRSTARIRIESEMDGAEIEVVGGKIVQASMGELEGWAALLAMLGISEGHFRVIETELPDRPPIATSVGALLAEKERRIVEWRKLSERAPPLSSVLKPTEAGSQELGRTESERRLLELVDGRRTLAEVIEESGIDAVEALGVLIDAIAQGLAQAEAPQLSLFPLAKESQASAPGDRVWVGPIDGGSGTLRKRTVIGMGLDLSEYAEAFGSNPPATEAKSFKPAEVSEAAQPRATVQRIINVTSPTPQAVPVPKRRSRLSTTPPPPVERVSDDPGPPSAPSSARLDGQPRSGEARGRGRRYIGRYEVLCRIGSGGMGSVYLSRLTSEVGFKRLFALKVLRSHLVADSTAAQKFLEEASLAGQIHHPNVVSVVDAGIENSQPFLAMDYVEGGSLKQLLLADPIRRPPELIIPVVLDGLSGLHAAHQLEAEDGTPLNIVHSDVSPENLMVGVDGVCRLTDFGVAKPGGLRRRNEAAHGKPGYMAPEQILGGRVDRRADIFAMGALLYNSLTGIKLFESPTVEETLRQVVNSKIPPPSTVSLKPPPSLDLICIRALDRDPARRFATAEEMMLELRRVALRENLLAPTNAIAEWVRQSLGRDLAQRRLAVLDASRSSRSFSQIPATQASDSSVPPEKPAREARPTPPKPRVAVPQDLHGLSRTIVIGSVPSPKRWAMIAAACLSALAVLFTLVWPDYVSRIFRLKTENVASGGSAGAVPPTPPIPTGANEAPLEQKPPALGRGVVSSSEVPKKP